MGQVFQTRYLKKLIGFWIVINIFTFIGSGYDNFEYTANLNYKTKIKTFFSLEENFIKNSTSSFTTLTKIGSLM